MTDRQFDIYHLNLLKELKRAQLELQEQGAESKTLNELVEAIENQLMRE